MDLFTIGFTQKTAAEFFAALQDAGVKRVVDVRRNNVSQLAGFTKRDDLAYFLSAVAGIDYLHAVDLSPSQDLIDGYRKDGMPYRDFAAAFRKELRARKVEKAPDLELRDGDCLLCSEPDAGACHRSVVASYLSKSLGKPTVIDL